jgi:hypothetical protein
MKPPSGIEMGKPLSLPFTGGVVPVSGVFVGEDESGVVLADASLPPELSGGFELLLPPQAASP